jgi:chromosomal replication initiation ATPase DnaA
MHQQRLNWLLPDRPDDGGWVRHAGVEDACNRLALWLVHGGRLWLASEEVAGKSHLLSLLAAAHPQLGLISVHADASGHALQLVRGWLRQLESKAFWAVDVQAGPLTQAHAFALFHLLERAREMRRPIVLAWRSAGPLPPELDSRLKGMERVVMQAPRSDEELRQVMRAVAASLQWQIPDALLDVLLVHLPRHLDALPRMLRSLEADSLQHGKRLTPAWVRKWLEGAETEL